MPASHHRIFADHRKTTERSEMRALPIRTAVPSRKQNTVCICAGANGRTRWTSRAGHSVFPFHLPRSVSPYRGGATIETSRCASITSTVLVPGTGFPSTPLVCRSPRSEPRPILGGQGLDRPDAVLVRPCQELCGLCRRGSEPLRPLKVRNDAFDPGLLTTSRIRNTGIARKCVNYDCHRSRLERPSKRAGTERPSGRSLANACDRSVDLVSQ